MPLPTTTTAIAPSNVVIETRNQAIDIAQDIFINPDKYVMLDVEHDNYCIFEIAIVNPKAETILNAKIDSLDDWLAIQDLLTEQLQSKTIIVWNRGADIPALTKTAEIYKTSNPVGRHICALQMSKVIYPNKASHANGGNHTALDDCHMSLHHLKAMANEQTTLFSDSLDELAQEAYALYQLQAETSDRLKAIEMQMTKKLLNDPDFQSQRTFSGFLIEKTQSITGIELKEGYNLDDVDPKYISPRTLKSASLRALVRRGEIDDDMFSYTVTDKIDMKKLKKLPK